MISAQFSSALQQASLLHSSPLSSSSQEFQSSLAQTLASLDNIKLQILSLALFSANETFDDISSSDLKYLLVSPYIADLVLLKTHPLTNPLEARQFRIHDLNRAKAEIEEFIRMVENYEIVRKVDLEYFEGKGGKSGEEKRNQKIARFKYEKELKNKLEYLKNNPTSADDDVVRETTLLEIHLQISKSVESYQFIKSELDLLSSAPIQPPQPPPSQEQSTSTSSPTDYTERLELQQPLLSPSGVPLRPFTLTSRTAIADGVFKPHWNLPTMTIDEYLALEMERGNFLQGGGEMPEKKIVEFDGNENEEEEMERKKKMDWDEFTDANKRGSGNRFNKS
ncbi:hypothetical protein HK098_001771 [Nowakowskiella sp. JEL0407]|nr:hypothetical protein HK098_001771 [Nowakowskiella sp. JEL0407]